MIGSLAWLLFCLYLYLEVSKSCSYESHSRTCHCFNKLPCLGRKYVSNNSNITEITKEEQLAQFWRIFLLPSLPMGTGGDTVLCAGQ